MTDWRSDLPFVDRTDPIDTDNCAREPLHLKPYLQPGSALVAWEHGIVVAVSANLGPILGRSEADLLDRSIHDVLQPWDVDLTTVAGAPGTVFQNARPRRHRSPSGPEILELLPTDPEPSTPPGDIVLEAVGDLHGASTSEAVRRAATAIHQLCGYDRVWGYRFHDDGHGEVVAEHKRADLPSFLGLHYPATDIPEAARRLFLEQPVRVIGDVDGQPVAIIESESIRAPLDLSHATSRGVSPIHLAYLQGMGVTASLSLALVVGGRLWGLLSAHHYSGPKHPSKHIEEACSALAATVALQLGAAERTAIAEARLAVADRTAGVVAAVESANSIVDGLVAAQEDLLTMTASTGAVVRVAGRVRSFGSTLDDDQTGRLLDELDRRLQERPHDTAPIVAESLGEVDTMVGTPEAAGFLALPLAREPGNWIVWFRPEYIRTVNWGDNSRGITDGHRPLSPEDSFRQWTQTVVGRCRPWDQAAVDAAVELRSGLGTHVLRQAEQLARSVAALQSTNRELDRFAYVAAHDLNEPLRGIVNYVDIIEEDGGDRLPDIVRPHMDSIRDLADRMSDLVASLLTYASVGRQRLQLQPLLLSDLVAEAERLVSRRLADTGASVRLVRDTPLTGDRVQLVQVLANLIGNAAKYRGDDDPVIEIEPLALIATSEGRIRWPKYNADVPPPTVIAVRDNGIGVAEEHREAIFEVFRRLHGHDEFGGGTGAGLSIARRIAERHGGHLWCEPNQPSGTVFYLAVADPEAQLPVVVDD